MTPIDQIRFLRPTNRDRLCRERSQFRMRTNSTTHSTVRARFPEIETIYRAYQVLLLKAWERDNSDPIALAVLKRRGLQPLHSLSDGCSEPFDEEVLSASPSYNSVGLPDSSNNSNPVNNYLRRCVS